eukprot:Gb_24842 [translate_table: standard]
MDNWPDWYWRATVTREQLEKTCRSIQHANQSIDQMVGVTNLETTKKLEKQITRREEESPHKLLEFEPGGISEQMEKVKGLLEIVIVDAEKPDKTAHIVELQKDILSDMGEGKLHLRNPEEGRKKLLPMKMSGEKMRILITSRTNAVRQELRIHSDCIKDYSVERLSDETAMDLLGTTIRGDCSHSSPRDFDDDVEINAIARACYGVPLLLDTYGRYLKEDQIKEAYKYALDSLQKGNFQSCSDTDLGRQILYVYDKMEEEAREAFLDICVFFYGWEWDVVASIVGKIILENLVKRALVKKKEREYFDRHNMTNTKWNEVIVHDVLRLRGRNKAAGTRLQGIEELSRVLEKGGEAITKVKGIWLLDNESPFNFKSKDLEAMYESFRVLAPGDCTMLDGECRKTFYNLRFL